MAWEVRQGDVLERLAEVESDSVDCILTSPPYWGLRDYGVEGQLGLEPHPEEYLEKLWEVAEECRRVLKPSGVCWWNLGDTYGSGAGEQTGKSTLTGGKLTLEKQVARKAISDGAWLRPKQLLGIPWRFAIGAQERGWLLRNSVVWHKPNAMPSSVRDRFSCTYEFVFLLVKEPRYWFDLDAVREPCSASTLQWGGGKQGWGVSNPLHATPQGTHGPSLRGEGRCGENPDAGKNPGDCWDICTEAFPEAHFAVFPSALVRRCLRAGCPAQVCEECGKPWERVTEQNATGRTLGDPKEYKSSPTPGDPRKRGVGRAGESCNVTIGWQPTCTCSAGTKPGLVLDPFCGAGTTGLVATQEGRNFLGIELNSEYVAMAEYRISQAEMPLF